MTENTTSVPDGMSPQEWELRLDLAGLYRVVNYLGWNDLIFNHITARIPGNERHFLINPFGLGFDEVTASNLVKIDINGVQIGASAWPVNVAGFVVHASVHRYRDDAHCVLHTHTREGVAVACKANGLFHDSFYGAMLLDNVAYHDFEGITVHEDEVARIAANLGQHNAMILRNHGLLACGEDIASAFFNMWVLQRACESQCDAQALSGNDHLLSTAVKVRTREDREQSRIDPKLARTVLDALLRKCQKELTPETDYRR